MGNWETRETGTETKTGMENRKRSSNIGIGRQNILRCLLPRYTLPHTPVPVSQILVKQLAIVTFAISTTTTTTKTNRLGLIERIFFFYILTLSPPGCAIEPKNRASEIAICRDIGRYAGPLAVQCKFTACAIT